MKASELRIGNKIRFIDIPDCEAEVNAILQYEKVVLGNDINHVKDETWGLDALEPIPLTEEWLLKFGFYKAGESDGVKWFNLNDDWELELGEEIFFWVEDYPAEVKYVHSLQNLYFALTGTELTLK